MQSVMNVKIKERESFRPFAPAVLSEHASEWFAHTKASPYMLFVSEIAPQKRRPLSGAEEQLSGLDRLKAVRSDIPAVTHVDGTARLQTVHKETNARFHRLLSAFHAKTGCPVLINTSFNVRGEPIVASPEDAYRCFMRTQMDVLVIGNLLLMKTEQPTTNRAATHEAFELD